MKRGKRIVSVLLVAILVMLNCFPNVLGATNEEGQTEVDVSRVYSGHNSSIVTFELSGSDYGVEAQDIESKHTEYNYWTDIQVFQTDGTSLSLENADNENQRYYAMWNRENTISIELKEDIYQNATKIVIPAGTVFPSKAYTNNSSSDKCGYITTTDLEFIRPSETISSETDWIRSIPITETETRVTKIHMREPGGRLLLFLDTHDYKGVTASTTLNSTSLLEYNFMNYIEVYDTSGNCKKLSEIYANSTFFNLYGENGTIGFELNADWKGDTISKVIIKEGCELPSYQYITSGGTTKNGYVVKKDTTFTTTNYAATNQAWTRSVAPIKVETSIDKIHVRNASGKLLIFPTVHDYPDTISTLSVEKMEEYNTLDHIIVYKSDSEYKKLSELVTGAGGTGEKYYNIWGEKGCFSVDMIDGWDGTTIKKIVIKEGCQLPSYQYTNNGAYDNYAYVVKEEMVYITSTSAIDNVDWVLTDTSTPQNITVDGIKSGHNGKIVTFKLSDSDYICNSNTPVNDAPNSSEYNYWTNIKIYTEASEPISLGDAYYDQKYYYMYEMPNTVSIQLKEEVFNSITKIEIPSGTIFPSLNHTNNNSYRKGGFITTSDIVYVKPTDGTSQDWTVYVGPSTEATGVTKIDFRNNALSFYLSVHDYAEAPDNDRTAATYVEYNYWEKVLIYTSETDYKTLKSAYENKVNSDTTFYNLWTEKGTYAVSIDQDSLNNATKIVIPAGTEFPSYRYTSGSINEKKSFVTTEDITYVKNSSGAENTDWTEYIEPVVHTTTLNKIQVRTGKLFVFLNSNDYADAVPNNEDYCFVGSKLTDYNILDNIVLATATESKTLGNVLGANQFYNLFGETGSIAFDLAPGWDGTTVTKVTIKAGCEFPAYAYTSGATNAKTSYVVASDYIYTTKSSNDVNEDWTKVEARTIETTIKNVVTQNDDLTGLTFTLSKNDYAPEQTDAYAMKEAGEKHKDYNWFKNIRIYTDETNYVTLSEAYATHDDGHVYYTQRGTLTASIGNYYNSAVRIVIPKGTLFPVYAYTNGAQAEMSGYEITHETIFEKIDGVWTDVSLEESKVSADVRGDGIVDSRDLVCMKKYLKNGYRHNETSDCDVDGDTDIVDLGILREVLLGRVLHNYQKESSNLLHFSSSDMELDHFLNDYFKRQVGYVDYEEGDMSVTSSKPGKAYVGIFNQMWNTKALSWFNSADSLESDRTASIKAQLEAIPVDRYGYVWDGMDVPEDPTNYIGESHSMGWPFPNATHTNTAVRFWEFNEGTSDDQKDSASATTWETSGLSDVSPADGLYKGTASNASSVVFSVKDDAFMGWGWLEEKIIDIKYAPWLAIDLRMYNVTNYAEIDDVYVSYTTEKNGTEHTVKAGNIAAVTYPFSETYEHTLYLPMYTQSAWNSATDGIFSLKIEIKAKGSSGFSGEIGLNYVRPSFDTRYSNNNSNYISSLKEYYAMTGDLEFLQNNITKARKAMNFYLQMYNESMQLNDQSYLYGHGGSKTDLATGLGNGYWDILYTPQYDLQSNLYFYRALEDMVYLENVLTKNNITVDNSSAQVDTAPTGGKGTGKSEYTYTVDKLTDIASAVKSKVQSYFWNADTGRFMAGYDEDSAKVDYGYTMWNLEAVEMGIATDEQEKSIMQWINGDREVSTDTSKTNDIYKYVFAPRCNTVDDVGAGSGTSGIYGALIQNDHNPTIAGQKFGECVQFGGSIMYTSYYDLMSRIDVKGADNAFTRLKGIQSWYDAVYSYYMANDIAADEFYLMYYESQGITVQNGSKGQGNGAVGIDGEFTESLLTLAAIPYGFFGIDTDDGKNLKVAPSLPSELDHWKVENMSFNGVTYDLSIFEDAVRIDSVRGETTGLSLTVTLDCTDKKKVYVDGVEAEATIADGKATVEIPFSEAIVEVK